MQKDRQAEHQKWIEEKELADQAHLEKIHSELAPYIEKVEHEPQITADLQAHGVTATPKPASDVITKGPTIVLPLSEAEVEQGLHHKVFDAVKWLAQWCVRIAEIARRRGISVFFGKDYISQSELSKLENIKE